MSHRFHVGSLNGDCIVCGKSQDSDTAYTCAACGGSVHRECLEKAKLEACPKFESHQETLAIIVSMGFGEEEAEVALEQNRRDVERTIDWLLEHTSEASAMVKERNDRDKAEEERIKRASEEIKEKALLKELEKKEMEVEKEVEEKVFHPENKPIVSDQISAAFSVSVLPEPTTTIDIIANEEMKTVGVQQINQTNLAIDIIKDTSSLLGVSLEKAQLLLHQLHWDKERITTLLTKDDDTTIQQLVAKLSTSPISPFYTTPNAFNHLSQGIEETPEDAKEREVMRHEHLFVSQGECPVCDVSGELISLSCGDAMCSKCWENHIKSQFEVDDPSRVHCSFCSQQLDFLTAWMIAEKKSFLQYWKYVSQQLVQACDSVSICPNCGVPHFKQDPPVPYVCTCCTAQCSNCCNEYHAPASCKNVNDWKSLGDSEGASAKRIRALAKPCRFCGVLTERNDGCNHMTCQRCKGQWCWLCRGDWSTHSAKTGGLYRCTFYENSEAKKMDEKAKEEIAETKVFEEELKKYTPINEKIETFKKSLGTRLQAARKYYKTSFPENELFRVTIYSNALNSLIKAYNFEKYSIVFRFYETKEFTSVEWYMYDLYLKNLNNAVERLDELITKNVYDTNLLSIATKIVDKELNEMTNYLTNEMLSVEDRELYHWYTHHEYIENYNFVYSGTAFDKKGIVYWIGTNKGTEPFKNPVERDFGIKCRRSSGTTGSPNDVLSYKPQEQWTLNKPNGFWEVDFGKFLINPTYYSLRTYSGAGLLRNWNLEGSKDGTTFVPLIEHRGDKGLKSSNSSMSWKISNVSEYYRVFRIHQVAKNSAGDNYLTLSSFEIYGNVMIL